MLDRSSFWSEPVAADVILERPSLTLKLLPPLPQLMISGDPARARARFDLPQAAGLLDQANGARYALRLARQRILAVGISLDDDCPSWSEGLAMSSMTGALAVMEISGPASLALVAQATAISLATPSPSAALLFAGIHALLYKHGDRLRLHFDRGFTNYMTNWVGACDIAD